MKSNKSTIQEGTTIYHVKPGKLRETIIHWRITLSLFESMLKASMGMSFFAMPSHCSEQWAFQNGAHRLVP
jgi:hypothetical protein